MEANKVEKCELREEDKEDEDEGEEDIEILKKRISTHPLCGLLMEAHFNCLKVSLGDLGENFQTSTTSKPVIETNLKLEDALQTRSELDHFMEAYCLMLGELKEAMEKPLEETSCFVSSMYEELNQLADTNDHRPTSSDYDHKY